MPVSHARITAWYPVPKPELGQRVADMRLDGRLADTRLTAISELLAAPHELPEHDEQGTRIFLATGLRSSWAKAWPAFGGYS